MERERREGGGLWRKGWESSGVELAERGQRREAGGARKREEMRGREGQESGGRGKMKDGQ